MHSQDENTEDVARFRQLIVELDRAVIDAFGWQDIELNHQFVSTKRGARFGLDGTSRLEILKRLSELNRERSFASIDARNTRNAAKPKRGRTAKATPTVALDGLFDGEDS
ncbi:hypothetical protein D9M70_558820 [compost metagenome]